MQSIVKISDEVGWKSLLRDGKYEFPEDCPCFPVRRHAPPARSLPLARAVCRQEGGHLGSSNWLKWVEEGVLSLGTLTKNTAGLSPEDEEWAYE